MPRHNTSPPQTNSPLLNLPNELFARITQKLSAVHLADFRQVCKQFATLGQKDAILVWINRHFPATTQAVHATQQPEDLTFAQKKISEIDIILTKESPNSLLPASIMPSLLELQHYDLGPLYRNFAKIEQNASGAEHKQYSDLRKNVLAILPELDLLFLWIKTGNMPRLKEITAKLTSLNVLWLLNNLDRNHLSAVDWAQITGNQELLDIFYNEALRFMYLNAGLGEFRNGVFDPRYQTNILQLAIRCAQSPQQFLKIIYSVDIMKMIPLLNTRGENSLHFAARSLNPRWLEYLLARTQEDPSLVACLEQKIGRV